MAFLLCVLAPPPACSHPTFCFRFSLNLLFLFPLMVLLPILGGAEGELPVIQASLEGREGKGQQTQQLLLEKALALQPEIRLEFQLSPL